MNLINYLFPPNAELYFFQGKVLYFCRQCVCCNFLSQVYSQNLHFATRFGRDNQLNLHFAFWVCGTTKKMLNLSARSCSFYWIMPGITIQVTERKSNKITLFTGRSKQNRKRFLHWNLKAIISTNSNH